MFHQPGPDSVWRQSCWIGTFSFGWCYQPGLKTLFVPIPKNIDTKGIWAHQRKASCLVVMAAATARSSPAKLSTMSSAIVRKVEEHAHRREFPCTYLSIALPRKCWPPAQWPAERKATEHAPEGAGRCRLREAMSGPWQIAAAHRIRRRAMETGGFSPNVISLVSSYIDPREDIISWWGNDFFFLYSLSTLTFSPRLYTLSLH